ncbi:IS3 family transposase [Streptomyces somaliensis]|uniref:IS3 family transposase n=1 Tax=Streptomyces somaliensis TaxID=78355 RepID=UPI0020CD16E0|nr:IS3 family transposase [Streptomyces somaliensis]MCP9944177.1 IS3 family transposase [Streptomyces somaliensis]MCP9962587.1 IS3 family transposase [Streptomyces somaliensis]MCP9975415.1 IS3 family transposase [Streptomyces somaliensis]
MESLGKKKPRPRHSFTPEFKAEIVELCRRGDRSVGQVAKDFDLTETAVRDWVKQAEVHASSRGSYGAPRVHAALQKEGDRCGRRRVARLMRQAGLEGRHRRRRQRTTIPDPRAAMRPNLVERDFQPDAEALDVRWCGDITYVPTQEG